MSRRGVSRRILLCDSQRPFQRDLGAARLDALAEQLRHRDFEVDRALLPAAHLSAAHLSATPASAGANGVRRHLFDTALAWRLLDLTAGAKQTIHLLLATRFPAYVAHHPNKVVWLLPDELPTEGRRPGGTEAAPGPDPEADRLRRSMERRAFAEARRLFVATPERGRRIKHETGLDAVLLPLPAGDLRTAPDAAWDEVVEQLTSTL